MTATSPIHYAAIQARAERASIDARRALSEGRDMLRREGIEAPTASSVVWRLIQDAAATLQSLPDKDYGWLNSYMTPSWPEVYTTFQERFETEVERLKDGITVAEPLIRNKTNCYDVRAVPRMLTVLDWFRFMRARTHARHKRDVRITLALARGASMAEVRRIMASFDGRVRGHSAAHMVKQKTIGQIASRLKNQGFL